MAEDTIRESTKITSNIWLASTTYYINYYSLYALLQKIGIKCEIHSCTIEIMKKHLLEQYNKEEIKLLEETFKIRNELQYYANREESQEKLKELNKKAKQFYIKTKEIINKITEEQTEKIKKQLTTQK